MKPPLFDSLRRAWSRVVGHPVSVKVAKVGVREKVVIVAAMALTVSLAVVIPAPPTEAEVLAEYISDNAQSMSVSPALTTTEVARVTYTSISPGIATLAAGGTNRDWAQLVLLSGGWPQTDSNITVIMRWMRQENGTNNWWNRNNPLNNGWGSGGGGGTGRYANLVVAAQKAAEALGRVPGYAGIVSALANNAETSSIESAIWASPWASGHYAEGGHWSYAEVPVVKSPEGTWG